ncbi:DUF6624 domain-containing protein [Streptomyces sp. NPDC052299]|uniref:DUF6624 domain-containing protein n=1 Tax=Streptomyces sp. NPDC052299 TaxID=3155054 RepID=UPI00342E19C6
MNAIEPQRPDLARELIARASQAAGRRTRRIRNRLNGVEVSHDRHADHVDAKVLRRILAEHDWPGHRLVGLDAARAAWSLALHADEDPDLQRAATTLLKRAVQEGDAPVPHWAHLQDRTLANSGLSQEFGTQQVLNAAGVELCPVRDPDSLDERRSSVGLPPIADALERVRRRLASAYLVDDVATVVLAEVA